MIDLINEIWQTLRNNRGRTILTGISVSWGIFMLIVLLGAARGVVNSFEYNTAGKATNTIQLWGGRTSKPYKGYEDGRKINLEDDDRVALASKIGEVEAAEVLASADTVKIYGPTDYISGFDAVFPGEAARTGLEMVHGRFLNGRDMDEQRRAIVMQEDKAELLFGTPEKALGKTVEAMNLSWTVVGIYKHRWMTKSYVPYPTFKKLTGNDKTAEELSITVRNVTTEEGAEAVEDKIREQLAQRHDFNPTDRSAVWSWNRFANHIKNAQGLGYLNIAVWVIGVLTLLTGIVGVSNIMFVSVKERTHEIGIRRAIGAKPRSIVIQVLSESVALTAIFGYIGIVAGMGVLQIVKNVVGEVDGFRNPTVDLTIAVEVTIALIIAGALAGLFPALRAIKVKPVEALRDE